METNDEKEMLLWAYIDGSCSSEERPQIEALIAQNAAWQQRYEELCALHAGLQQELDLQEPSMRFARNVMDAIAATSVAPATKRYINRSVITGIAAFFMLTIAAVLVYAAAITNWTWGSPGTVATTLRRISSRLTLDGPTFNIFIIINIILILALADKLLRRVFGKVAMPDYRYNRHKNV